MREDYPTSEQSKQLTAAFREMGARAEDSIRYGPETALGTRQNPGGTHWTDVPTTVDG